MPKSNSFKEELKKLEGMLNRLNTKKSSEKSEEKALPRMNLVFSKLLKLMEKR